jgi:hypothetical protein
MNMTPEKLLDAAETLKWLSERLQELPDDKEALILALHCMAASMGCIELASHKMDGRSDRGALAATVRGELEINQEPALKTIADKYLH